MEGRGKTRKEKREKERRRQFREGGGPGVERQYIEAARSAENFLTYLFFTYEETALVASRYIEGHALTLCIYTVTVTKQHAQLLNSN